MNTAVRRLVSIAAWGLLAGIFAGCPEITPPEGDTCFSDKDCAGNRLCVNSACVDPQSLQDTGDAGTTTDTGQPDATVDTNPPDVSGDTPTSDAPVGAEDFCRPCLDDSSCSSANTSCVSVGLGSFCVPACASNADCPVGSSCQQLESQTVCLRDSGGCGQTGASCLSDWQCEDLDPCTSDQCNGGICSYASALCDDGNPCTDDSCDPDIGCVSFPATGTSCDDGQYCTVDDTCQDGTCVGGARDCSAFGQGCVSGVCDESQQACKQEPLGDGALCSDGTDCTANDSCVAGLCIGTPVGGCCSVDADCDDGNPCTLATCEVATGTCQYNTAGADGTPCDDGLYCTTNDECGGGVCSGETRDCSIAAGLCNGGGCDEDNDTCVSIPLSTGACDDGNPCTSGDSCQAGQCAGSAYTCEDTLSCTTASCDGVGGCNFVAQAGFCVIDGACIDQGTASSTNPCLACDPNIDPNGYVPVADGSVCDDGVACTGNDQCTGGICGGETLAGCCVTDADCDDSLPCTDNTCEAGGNCVASPKVGWCFIGGACFLDDAPNPADGCLVCKQGLAEQWSPKAEASPCDDGDECTIDDQCDGAGTCIGTIGKDSDGDTFIDAACGPPGDDCNDNDGSVYPGAPDPIEGLQVNGNYIDRGGDRDAHVSLAVDGSGYAHVAVQNTGTSDFEYGTNKFGFWGTAFIDRANVTGLFNSLAVGGGGAAANLYFNETNGQLLFATNLGGTWIDGELVSTDAHGPNALAAGGDGSLHAVWINVQQNQVLHRTRSAGPDGVWDTVETVATGTYDFTAVDAVVDSAGVVHVTMVDNAEDEVWYAANAGGAWVIESVTGTGSNYDGSGRIALGPGDTVWAHYRNSSQNRIEVAERLPDGTWQSYIIREGTPDDQGDFAVHPDGRMTACAVRRVTGPFNSVSYYLDVLTNSGSLDAPENWDALQVLGPLGSNNGLMCRVALTADGDAHVAWTVPGSGVNHTQRTGGGIGYERILGLNSPGRFNDIVQTADGTLHIIFKDDNSNELRHARQVPGGSWEWELIDANGDIAGEIDAAVDPDGQTIHIVHNKYNGADQGAIYSVGSWGNWTPWEDITPGVDTNDADFSLVVDDAGVPSVAWFRSSGDDLWFGTRAGGTWTVESVEIGGNVGRDVSLALDATGTFHLSYRKDGDGASNDLYYTRGTPGNWEPQQAVATDGDVGRESRLLLDGTNVYIGTYNNSNTKIQLAHSPSNGDPGTWTVVDVVDDGNSGQDLDLTMADDGTLVFAYRDDSRLNVTQGTLVGGFNSVNVDPDTNAIEMRVVASGGDIHVSYYDDGANDLMWASTTVKTWENSGQVIHPGDDVEAAAVDFGPQGLRACYREGANNTLHFAAAREGVYYRTRLETGNDPGQYCDIAVDATGVSHIVHRRGGNSSTRYARVEDGVNPFRATVRDVGNDGNWSAIAVDSTGTPHVVWQNTSDNDLIYATTPDNGSTWNDEVLATQDNSGQHADIAVDANDTLHVIYKYDNTDDLRYLTGTAGSWTTSSDIATTDNVGDYGSIAMGPSGTVHVSWYNNTSDDVYYADNTEGAYVPIPVETDGDVGRWSSLVLDDAGNAYIAYRDESSDDVRLATNVSGTWQLFDVETTNNTGEHIDLAIAPDGTLWAVYRYVNGKDLRVARITLQNAVDANCDGY